MNKFFFAALLSAVAVSATPALKVGVAGPTDPVDINGLIVNTIVTNIGDEPLQLLNSPNSVLSMENTDKFDISSSTNSPKFMGIRMKWSPALAAASSAEEMFTSLSPGQSIEKTHSLAGVYNFTQSGEGTYTFTALNVFDYVDSSGVLKSIYATSGAHGFQLSGLLAAPNSGQPNLLRRAEYPGCSRQQQLDIQAAAEVSNGYIDRANSYFSLNSPNKNQYTTWFGNGDKTTVMDHFQKIGNQATANSYDCSCTKEDVFAYVYPNAPGKIYLCSAFWRAPITGTDSRAGTIVHENSHFDQNGGTRDYAYGQGNCMSLARSYPEYAIMNADNHEYFVETMTL